MKFIPFAFLAIVASSYAASVPTGNFDCGQYQGSYLVNISQSADGSYFMRVKNVNNGTETELEGHALVAKQKAPSNKSFNLIRLPGSNVELFFDQEGNLGLDKNVNSCKKTS